MSLVWPEQRLTSKVTRSRCTLQQRGSCSAAAQQLLFVHCFVLSGVRNAPTPLQRLYLEVGYGASLLSVRIALSGKNRLIVLTKMLIDFQQRPPAHSAHRGIVNAHFPHILPYQR